MVLKPLMVGSPVLGTVAATVYALLQATHFDVSIADFLAFGGAASAFPGVVGLLLYKKWDETDKHVRELIGRVSKVESRLDTLNGGK